jgi:hypothetical protein
VTLLRLLIFVILHGGTIERGVAPHYARGVMERVSANRGMAQTDCMISSPVYPLGTWLWVYGGKTDTLLLCRITDVSHPIDRQRHIRTGRIVELGFTEARRLCGTTRGSVKECPVLTVKL